MFFSIFARGSITSRPQPVQRILKSMPTRSTSKLDAPQGCFLRVRMDFKIRCTGCGREVMLPRAKIEKNIKKVVKPGSAQ